MECACEIDIDVDSGDRSDFQFAKDVKARKAHKCNECGGEITPGQEYELAGGVIDGKFWKNKTCSVCLELRNKLFVGGYFYGMIEESIQDIISEVGGMAESCISGFSPKARSALCDIIEEALDWKYLNTFDDED